MIALSFLDGVVPVAAAWFLRLLLNAVSAAHVSQSTVTISVAGIVLCGFLTAVGRAGQAYLQTVMQRSIRTLVEARLFRAIHSVDGLSSFEDPHKLDQLRLAEQAGESAPEGVLGSGLSLVQSAITAVGFVITILLLCPWLILPVLAAAVPTCLLQLRMAQLRAGVLMQTSMFHRRLIFYRYLATDVRAAKEVRLFGLGDFLLGRMLSELGRSNRMEAAVDRTVARIDLGIGALSGLVTLCGATVSAYLAAHHQLTVGDVTVLLAGIVALQMTVATVTESVSTGYKSLLMFRQYLAVAEPSQSVSSGSGTVDELIDGIEFDEVWFRYAQDLPWVLRGLSCRLPAGQAVGLVGLNGAGKTTMVKLLCRLYEPERGAIRWDGVDIRLLDPVQLRRRISAVFQDFMAYDFTAADNIAVGSLDAMDDLDRIRQAAARAGADDKIDALAHGYHTMLSRIFPADEGGSTATLSGGEWQRLALARAFLRTEADVMILDEPTSGLDAQVEHELHHTIRSFRSGRLSLLISHRLSALSSADLILVLADGVIFESGTPAELMSAGGSFAQLYALQAEGYHLAAAGTEEVAGEVAVADPGA